MGKRRRLRKKRVKTDKTAVTTTDKHTYSETRMIVCNMSRVCLDALSFAKFGELIRLHLSVIIDEYSKWVAYPKGDRIPLEGHTNAVYSAVVSHSGLRLYTGDGGGLINIWRLSPDISLIDQWPAHHASVSSLDISGWKYENRLLSSGMDHSIRVWSVNQDTNNDIISEHSLIRVIHGHTSAVNCAVFNHPRSNLIISASNDEFICIWSVKKGTLLHKISNHGTNRKIIYDYSDSITKGHFMSIVKDEYIAVYDSGNGQIVRTHDMSHSSMISDISLNCDASILAVSLNGTPDSITLFKWPRMIVIGMIESQKADKLCFHPTLPNFLVFSDFNQCGIIDTIQLKLLKLRCFQSDMKKHRKRSTIQHLCFTPDGCRLISSSFDKTLWIYDTSFLYYYCSTSQN